MLLASGILPLLSLHATAQTVAAAPSIAEFFKNPSFSKAELSPDGQTVAMLVADKNDRVMLAAMDVVTMQAKILAKYTDSDIRSFHWVNGHRLVYDLTDLSAGAGDINLAPGLFAINKDGSESRQLAERVVSVTKEHSINKIMPWNTYFQAVKHVAGSDEIFVIQSNDVYSNYRRTYSLISLNTVTGKSVAVSRPGDVSKWVIDQDGQARIAVTEGKGTSAIFYRDPANEEWQKLTEFDTYGTKNLAFSPLFFGPDGKLLVTARLGKDTYSVYQYDIASRQLAKDALVSLKGYDFKGQFLFNKEQKKLLGIRHETDAIGTTWFDQDMQQLQKKIDSYLPSTANLISISEEKRSDFVLIFSYSDTHPGIWRLYDIKADKFHTLGESHPGINPKQMADKDMVRYKARDGLEIPAYLTLPKGKTKNLPMVVLVHGGPYVRGGHWNWDAQVQFLASRGYAVLEPDFRGSTGYGYQHFRAGWKQWGLAMQDDITDGTRWAIAKGYADPQRICIAGASYGGYATLMGLIREPDLYRCGIDWVGVTDINLLYNVSWSDITEYHEKYGMPAMVGDQLKDAEQLKTTSPLLRAAEIKQPLLLAYGAADQRVPLVHGSKFYDAVKANNPKVEWVVYPEEGHGWRLLKNKVDFWGRVDKFLDANIGH